LLKPIAERLRIVPAGRTLPAAALDRIAQTYMCSDAKACVAVWLDDKRIGVMGQNEPGDSLNFDFVTLNDAGEWVQGDRAKPTVAKEARRRSVESAYRGRDAAAAPHIGGWRAGDIDFRVAIG
jgi:hypothetical protein